MKSFSIFLLSLFGIVFSVYSQQVPKELHGKWNLRASSNKLIGSIDIKADGKYFYTALPNYKESGVLIVRTGKNGKEIDLVVKTKTGSDITRGVYKIVNNQLQLCLGKKNGDRPSKFETNPKMSVILWVGSK